MRNLKLLHLSKSLEKSLLSVSFITYYIDYVLLHILHILHLNYLFIVRTDSELTIQQYCTRHLCTVGVVAAAIQHNRGESADEI